MFPSYILDETKHIRAGPETNVVNLKKLMALFRSESEDKWRANRWIFENESKYLDGEPKNFNQVGFTSFPRSGNTFLREYFEMLTGIATGADMMLSCNVVLQMQGLKAEDIIDDTVWVVKTHSPYSFPFVKQMNCKKMICIVRNPVDVIYSYIHLLTTLTHSLKPMFLYHEQYTEFWDWYVKLTSQRMA